MFLIRYDCAPHSQKVPTTADAGAGESWNYYFHPAPLGEPFGLTRAWCVDSDVELFKPEVVHEPVPLGCITQPIERVW